MNNFDLDNITLNQQQYIETIYSLSNHGGHAHAHAKEIAVKLNIKMPSVTEALQNLQSMGLINYKVRQAVTLTEQGEVIGLELHRRHQVFSIFFRDILGIDKTRSDNVACKIEHVVDNEIREAFSEFTEYLKKHVMNEKDNFIEVFKKKRSKKLKK